MVELPQIPYTDSRHFNGRPGGGMADAEDLKSSGDFSSWGFDSPPGHHLFPIELNRLFETLFSGTHISDMSFSLCLVVNGEG